MLTPVLPSFVQAKTQYTPRAKYHDTALSSIIKAAPDGYIPKNEREQLYEGPDAHNTCFDIPDESIDVFNVAANRRLSAAAEADDDVTSLSPLPVLSGKQDSNRQLESIVPGTGWEVRDEPPGVCDGTYNATCNRWTGNECVLYGHHDARGAIIGNEYSGWLVMTPKDLKEGLIILKLHTWHTKDESTRTKGWTTVDNKRSLRSSRQLVRSTDTPDLPEGFEFEFSIDGKTTSLKKDAFLAQKKKLQRVVEILTILDDPNFTKEPKDVEIGIRLKGSGNDIVFGLSHIYWA